MYQNIYLILFENGGNFSKLYRGLMNLNWPNTEDYYTLNLETVDWWSTSHNCKNSNNPHGFDLRPIDTPSHASDH